jgi:hypothetical protein
MNSLTASSAVEEEKIEPAASPPSTTAIIAELMNSAGRLRSSQFWRIEGELKAECMRRGMPDKYVAQEDNEEHDGTRKRRRAIWRSIENPQEKRLRLDKDATWHRAKRAEKKAVALAMYNGEKKKASPAMEEKKLPPFDATSILLKACGISDIKGECSVCKNKLGSFEFVKVYAPGEKPRGEPRCFGSDGERSDWERKICSHRNFCFCSDDVYVFEKVGCSSPLWQVCIKCQSRDPMEWYNHHPITCHSYRRTLAARLAEVEGIRVNCVLGRWKKLSVEERIMDLLNISGDELRRLANDATGTMEGLNMRRTISIFFRDGGGIFQYVDPVPDVGTGMTTTTLDIEHVEEIRNGEVIFDLRPEIKLFEITGVGGSPLYATGKVDNACYESCPEDLKKNVYRFFLPMQKKGSCRPDADDIKSAEIYINGTYATSVEYCQYYSSSFDKCGGSYYKFIYHYFGSDSGSHFSNPWGWYNSMSLLVRVGPISKTLIDKLCEEVKGNDPFQLLRENPHMSVRFQCMTFDERNLKKEHKLHRVVCHSQGRDFSLPEYLVNFETEVREEKEDLEKEGLEMGKIPSWKDNRKKHIIDVRRRADCNDNKRNPDWVYPENRYDYCDFMRDPDSWTKSKLSKLKAT